MLTSYNLVKLMGILFIQRKYIIFSLKFDKKIPRIALICL